MMEEQYTAKASQRIIAEVEVSETPPDPRGFNIFFALHRSILLMSCMFQYSAMCILIYLHQLQCKENNYIEINRLSIHDLHIFRFMYFHFLSINPHRVETHLENIDCRAILLLCIVIIFLFHHLFGSLSKDVSSMLAGA